MLRFHVATSAYGVKKYFEGSDYYADEAVGKWGGMLADRLGLSGQVDKASFDRLCDNLRPDGQKLTPRNNDGRRVGVDMIYSGPKSFGVVTMLAADKERRDLLQLLADTAEQTQQIMQADMKTRVRIGGQDTDRVTGNMAWASFLHTTSRPVDGKPPDMHPHVHAFTFNATEDPVEQKIKAGEFCDIVRDRPYYEALFFSMLADGLIERGFAIDRRAGGKWELAGVPQSVIDTFSKRTGEIEEEAKRLNVNDPGRKAELGAKTRAKKQKQLTPEQLRKAWIDQLTDAERDALAAVYRREVPAAREISARDAAAFAIEHCSEKLSVIPERELKRVALLHGIGSVGEAQVAAELPRQGVITDVIDGRVMATTEALQREEDYIASVAARGRGAVTPVGVAAGLSRTLADGKALNDGQWGAACGLLESSNRVDLIEGPAGAGKSSLLGKFDEGVKLAGESVTYLATTAGAVNVLQEDGFQANTLARFLVDEKMQKASKGGRVVIDESSMLGHKDAVRLFKLAEKLDLKPVFVGDPMQHGSVPRGSFLHVLKEYGCIRPHRLTEILRQESPEYRAAAQLLSAGDTLEGFDALDRMEWVKELASDEERYRQVAIEYRQALDDKKSILVVSPTHAEAARITGAIRRELREAGRLGADELAFTRLVAVDTSEAERKQATTYRPGDVIQFHQNAKGFKKGERLIVTDPAAVPVAEAARFSVYRPEAIALAAGDVIRFTGSVKTEDGEHTLRNGASHRIAGFTPGGNIRLDNGWLVEKDAGHFRHGFVETSFGSQGRTVKRAILAMSVAGVAAVNQEQLYVSASRAKERMTLYTDDKAAVRRAVQRSSRKLAALDIRPKAKPDGGAKKDTERRRRLTYYDQFQAAWSAPGGAHPMPPAKPPTHVDRVMVNRNERDRNHER
jgi:conjugative relaxase-like TrwC/TraI family protein